MNNGAGRPIVALDIDGTLGDYHGHFLRFAGDYLDMPMPDPDKINNGNPLWNHMGISRTTYREVKLAYRQGGMKRTMPVYPWAARLTHEVASAGAEVWICTTRPYLRLDNIDPDTREWLRRNDIHYDGVIFDTLAGKYSKYDELARQCGDRVVAIMDDLPEAIQAIPQSDMPSLGAILLKDQPYNRYWQPATYGAHRVGLGNEGVIFTMIWSALEMWKRDH